MEGSSDLLQALELACSQDPENLKVGEQQLDAWKNQTGFYSSLAVSYSPVYLRFCTLPGWFDALSLAQAIIVNRSVVPGARWMALTYIKNGVDKFWRPGAPK